MTSQATVTGNGGNDSAFIFAQRLLTVCTVERGRFQLKAIRRTIIEPVVSQSVPERNNSGKSSANHVPYRDPYRNRRLRKMSTSGPASSPVSVRNAGSRSVARVASSRTSQQSESTRRITSKQANMSAFTVSAVAPALGVRASVGPARRGAPTRVSQVSERPNPISPSLRDHARGMKAHAAVQAAPTAAHRVASSGRPAFG